MNEYKIVQKMKRARNSVSFDPLINEDPIKDPIKDLIKDPIKDPIKDRLIDSSNIINSIDNIIEFLSNSEDSFNYRLDTGNIMKKETQEKLNKFKHLFINDESRKLDKFQKITRMNQFTYYSKFINIDDLNVEELNKLKNLKVYENIYLKCNSMDILFDVSTEYSKRKNIDLPSKIHSYTIITEGIYVDETTILKKLKDYTNFIIHSHEKELSVKDKTFRLYLFDYYTKFIDLDKLNDIELMKLFNIIVYNNKYLSNNSIQKIYEVAVEYQKRIFESTPEKLHNIF